jgi:high frequency lysogenization protein
MNSFNPDPNAPTPRQLRLLALAAIFQAAGLAYAFAYQGSVTLTEHADAMDTVLKLALAEETDPLKLLKNSNDLHLGLKFLENHLALSSGNTTQPKTLRFLEPTRYAFALFKIERKVYRSSKMVTHITQQQHILSQRVTFFDQRYRHPSILAGMASTYLATAGTLRTRLKVKGQPTTLTDASNVDCIRACLFAGIQAAHLWNRLGGRPWQLFFGRSAMLSDIRMLAEVRHKIQNFRSH